MSNYRPPNPYHNYDSRQNGGPGGGGSSRHNQAPKGYVPGLGRGAAGFTTRSDIGPMAAASAGGGAPEAAEGGGGASTSQDIGASLSGSGSRSAELRQAKLKMRQMQQAASSAPPPPSQQQPSFGQAPRGYIPGLGRGAGTSEDRKEAAAAAAGPTGGGSYDQFGGYTNDRLFSGSKQGGAVAGQYDDEDEEADEIYAAIDERMNSQNKKGGGSGGGKKRKKAGGADDDENGGNRNAIGDQFRELKEQLSSVTEEQWLSLPDVGDYSLRYKQNKNRRGDVFTPLTDSLLESRAKQNADATAGGDATLAKTLTVGDEGGEGSSGYKSVVSNMSGLAEARGTVLGMSLDKMSKSATAGGGGTGDAISGGQTTIDPKGYLTSLSSVKVATSAEVGDVNKARLLLKSVRDTNPKHGPGWIAAARVEEAAGKILQARKIIQEGCDTCPENEDVWLEAARLHPPHVAKTLLATAVRRLPTSVKIFLQAADLETHIGAKRAVLRKGLEAIPTSVTLWKSAIELEEADDARVLLSVAVERIPHSVEMWLALAKLESYDNARKVLNKARKHLPAERAVWIAAAKLEESQHHDDIVDKIIGKAVQSLMKKHEAVVSRTQWLKEAERAELSGYSPLTAGAIVKHTIGLGVDDEDRHRTWADDANGALSRGATATARAILAQALASFPSKRSLWIQAVELERRHGDATSLDEVLAAASERLPRAEIFWLVRAKEKWMAGDVDKARVILTEAFAANPDSESVWLAAAKLEWETGEIERARVLLRRARERAGTERVYMKSALLERECKRYDEALELLDEATTRFPKFDKLYMMGGQICSNDLGRIDRAREYYSRGLKLCPTSVVLWTLASRLEEQASREKLGDVGAAYTKARSLFELARLKNPKNPRLWVEAVRLERRAGNGKMAGTLMAKALQECPTSGLLLSENISTSPRVEQKSKSADAIKKCPDDPLVISAVASLFAAERKQAKARKWFERAVVLDPDIGDSWAKYYSFELECGTEEQRKCVKDRCVKAEPKHGEVWCGVVKEMANRRKSVAEGLELVSEKLTREKHLN